MTRAKHKEPTVCPDCEAVFSAGRWQWLSALPQSAQERRCPACQRIADRVPAGFLTLSGEFFDGHREEIMNLIDNKVQEQKSQHPLKRIMNQERQDDGSLLITFTDNHLPTGIGKALESAYEGDLDLQFSEEAGQVRAYWQR